MDTESRLKPFYDDTAIAAADRFRQRKKTSVLAIVFTDIAGSTGLREELGDLEYENRRVKHDEEVRSIIEAEEVGAVVKGTGDGCLAVFDEPSTAVLRCLQIQQVTQSRGYFRLRIGIDMGQVSLQSEGGIVRDIFGRQVNRAARIQGKAKPGHILVSFQIYDCAVGWMPRDNPKWHDHGITSLRGFDREISIHEPFDPEALKPQEPFSPDSRASGGGEIQSVERSSGDVSLRARESGFTSFSFRTRVSDRTDRKTRSSDFLQSPEYKIRATGFGRGWRNWLSRLARKWGFGPKRRKVARTTREAPLRMRMTPDLPGRSSADDARAVVRPGGHSYQTPEQATVDNAPLNSADRQPLLRLSAAKWQGDPFAFYKTAIGSAVRATATEQRPMPRILWVDDYPRNTASERAFLESVGCVVDTVTSTEQGLQALDREEYQIVITDMGRDDNATAGLDLLRDMRRAERHVSAIVYSSSRAVSRYGDEAEKCGAILSTAGLFTLLDGVHQLLARPRQDT